MVTVTNYQKRENHEGETYFALEIQSDDLEFVVSKTTGRHYATVRRAFMATTFQEAMCKRMVGKEMPGSITKVACDPFEFTIPETGEIISRSHRYEYSPMEEVHGFAIEKEMDAFELA
jgi:hypothetical protein